MSTPYNPGQNPNNPNDPKGQNPYGQNPYGEQQQYGAQPADGNYSAHPEGVSSYGNYDGHDQLQPDYTRGEPGHAGYGMAGGNYNAAPTSYGYEPAPAQQGSNGMAIAALVLGILSLLGLLLVFPGLILGVIALILGIVGVRKANNIAGPGARKGMAIAGLVMGAIATILSVLMLIFGVSVAKQMIDDGVFEACEHLQDDTEAYQSCIEDEVNESFNQ